MKSLSVGPEASTSPRDSWYARPHAGDQYDVIVVGSGASGGWAAKRLTEAGVKVALLDAGRALTAADYREHEPAFALPYRNRAPEVIRRTRPIQKDCYACTEYNYDWFPNDLEEPYTTPEGKPFSWQGRMRVTGGRTNVWGRQSYRSQRARLQGRVVRRLRRGLAARLRRTSRRTTTSSRTTSASPAWPRALYELPDGRFLPPMGLTCAETQLRAAA